MTRKFCNIVITGASSGLGEALALEYAATGVTLHLSGRHRERLDRVAGHCREKGAIVHSQVMDVCDANAMAEWLSPLVPDLVIANAGISGGTAGGLESRAQRQAILDTNIHGVFNTLEPCIAAMQRAGQGQMVIIASLAGYYGFPGAPAYCASKAAVRVYGQALRGLLAGNGVGVTTVCPGYIKTAMTDANDFPMPLMVPAAVAARRIREGVARNRAVIVFPLLLLALIRLVQALPLDVAGLMRRLPKKKAL